MKTVSNVSQQRILDVHIPVPALPPATEDEIRQCRACVDSCPAAVSGQGGHNQTYHVARIIYHDFGLSIDEGEPIISKYNERCKSPWSENELLHKIKDAASKPGRKPKGWRRNVNAADAYQEGDYCPELEKYVLDPARTRPIVQVFLKSRYTDTNGRRRLHYADGRFWIWTNNKYELISEDVLLSLVIDFLTDMAITANNLFPKNGKSVRNAFPANPTIAKSIIDDLKGYITLTSGEIEDGWIGDDTPSFNPKQVLYGPTQVYDWKHDKFYDPDPRCFNRSTLAVDYDPNAPNPIKFIKFMKSLFKNDKESVWALLEYFGYAITNDTSLQKGLLLVGPPRSGKGALLRMMATLLGTENVCSPQTSAFSSEFGLQGLIGKQLLTISDARFAGKSVNAFIETMLNIIGEDRVQINQKYKDVISVRLHTRLIIASNEVPHLPDASGAVVNRFVAIRLTKSFLGKENFNLEKQLQLELAGILKFFIKGLHRLHKRKRFFQPKSGESILRNMTSVGNPLKDFVEECCVLGSNYLCLTHALYSSYKLWCDDNGERTLDNNVFGKNLMAAFSGIVKGQRADGTREYRGIALKSMVNGMSTPLNEHGGGVGDDS